jgi:hypothetical protein
MVKRFFYAFKGKLEGDMRWHKMQNDCLLGNLPLQRRVRTESMARAGFRSFLSLLKM